MDKMKAYYEMRMGGVPISSLIKNGVGLKDNEYWKELIEEYDLDSRTLLKIGIYANNRDVWVGVIKTKKVRAIELLFAIM